MKLSKGIYFPAWKIPSDQIIPKLLELDKKVKNKEITESQARKELIQGINPQPISSKELRPVSQVAKSKFDKEQSLDVFFEIDKFVRKFAEKYFKPENGKE